MGNFWSLLHCVISLFNLFGIMKQLNLLPPHGRTPKLSPLYKINSNHWNLNSMSEKSHTFQRQRITVFKSNWKVEHGKRCLILHRPWTLQCKQWSTVLICLMNQYQRKSVEWRNNALDKEKINELNTNSSNSILMKNILFSNECLELYRNRKMQSFSIKRIQSKSLKFCNNSK